MAHGTPDWGITAGAITTYQLTDLAELAVRLGSPISFDRRGDVIWWDDFEWGLAKWSTSAVGTGGSVALSTARARNGRNSCLLTAPSDGGQVAHIRHSEVYPTLSRLGFEVSVLVEAITTDITFQIRLFDGVALTTYRVRWRDATNDLVYLDAAGADVVFATGVPLPTIALLFTPAKLVVDAATGMYVRFLLGSRALDLSGIAARTAASAAGRQLEVTLINNGSAGTNTELSADDAILTQNEPA